MWPPARQIEKNIGARSADHALSVFRAMANWYAKRHDAYANPVVKGMGRVDKTAAKRKRILSDDELRAVWKQASGTFGATIRLLLLTGQRRQKVAVVHRCNLFSSWSGEGNADWEENKRTLRRLHLG
jgi:hypothetical protein